MNEMLKQNCSKQQELDVYCTFKHSFWGSKIFRGIIKTYNDDVIVLLTTDERELIIPIRHIDYIEVREMEERLND